MKKKTLILGLVLLLVTSASATTYVTFDDDFLESPRNGYVFSNFEVKNLGDHDTLQISVKDKPNDIHVAFSKSYFEDNRVGNSLFIGTGSGLGNKTITLEYTYKDYQEVTVGNETEINLSSTETSEKEITVRVYVPMAMCFSKGVEVGNTLQLGDISILLKSVKSSKITVNISGPVNINRGKCKEIKHPTNTIKLCVPDTFPAFQMAKLNIMGKTCPDVSLVTEKEKEEEEKKGREIKIKKLTKTYERGKNFVFRTVDKETGDPIGGVYLTFGTREGFLGDVTTDDAPAATGEIKIPRDFNQSTFYINIEGGFPKGYNKSFRTLSLQPWSAYKKEKQLVLSNLDVGGDAITGKVTNENGRVVPNSKVLIDMEGKRYERKPDEDGKFKFKYNFSGKLSVKATRTDMDTTEFDSEWSKEYEIKMDDDEDGVLNKNDKCPEEEGPEENDGCPKTEVEIEISKGKEEKFLPGKSYSGKLLVDGDVFKNYSGKIKVEGEEVDVEEGRFTFTTEEGKHKIVFEGTEELDNAKKTIKVKEKKEERREIPIQSIGLLLMVCVIFALLVKIIGKAGKKVRAGNYVLTIIGAILFAIIPLLFLDLMWTFVASVIGGIIGLILSLFLLRGTSSGGGRDWKSHLAGGGKPTPKKQVPGSRRLNP